MCALRTLESKPEPGFRAMAAARTPEGEKSGRGPESLASGAGHGPFKYPLRSSEGINRGLKVFYRGFKPPPPKYGGTVIGQLSSDQVQGKV